jgi:hypothetical protein
MIWSALFWLIVAMAAAIAHMTTRVERGDFAFWLVVGCSVLGLAGFITECVNAGRIPFTW